MLISLAAEQEQERHCGLLLDSDVLLYSRLTLSGEI